MGAKSKDAGRELGVAAVVTANVSQRDDRLRIQVLVDVAHKAQVCGALYHGNASELIHLQGEAARLARIQLRAWVGSAPLRDRGD